MEFDYCVIGAGFAGLTAALRLKQAGHSVALMEARDRVGGRTFTETREDGVWIDRGGAWIGPGHDAIKALMKEFGVAEYKQHIDGEAMMIVDGKQHRYGGTVPWTMSPWALANLGVGLLRVEEMCKAIPREAPWEAKKAAEWDRITLGEWIERGTLSRTVEPGSGTTLTIDACTDTGDPGIMCFITEGRPARRLGGLDEADRKATVLPELVKRFGNKAASPVEFHEQIWTTERYSGAGMISHTPPGVLTEYGHALRPPCGRIHWAGTESSAVMCGWVDGAVRSGERAATEVLAAETTAAATPATRQQAMP